jgi:hypothetical protein
MSLTCIYQSNRHNGLMTVRLEKRKNLIHRSDATKGLLRDFLTSSSFAISRGALLMEKQLHDLLRSPTVDCAIERRAHDDEQVCSIVTGLPHRLRIIC